MQFINYRYVYRPFLTCGLLFHCSYSLHFWFLLWLFFYHTSDHVSLVLHLKMFKFSSTAPKTQLVFVCVSVCKFMILYGILSLWWLGYNGLEVRRKYKDFLVELKVEVRKRIRGTSALSLQRLLIANSALPSLLILSTPRPPSLKLEEYILFCPSSIAYETRVLKIPFLWPSAISTV